MPRLSVCIITKNEEQNIARVLASVKDVADEVVVTDTGSNDRTVEIARRLGANVLHFDWIDDFSAAHNFCNRQASGDWLLLLDADEELLPESHQELRSAIDQQEALAFNLIRQDLSDADDPDRYTEMFQLRLFRNRDDLNFVGRFHHHPSPEFGLIAKHEALQVCDSTIRIRHDGFVGELRQAKLERAAHLLRLELSDRPGQFYYLVELGMTLLGLGDEQGHQRLAEAAKLLTSGDRDAQQCRGQIAMLLEYVLTTPALADDFPLPKSAAWRLASEHFPTSVPLLWHRARERFAANEFAQCAGLLEKAIELGNSQEYDRTISFDPCIIGDDALLNLGVCYVRLGRLRAAEKCFRKLIDGSTRSEAAAENLKAIRPLLKRKR